MSDRKQKFISPYSSNMAQIKEYGLSLPERKSRKLSRKQKTKETYKFSRPKAQLLKDYNDYLITLKKGVVKKSMPSMLILTNEEIIFNKLLKIREEYKDEIRIHGAQTEIKEGFVYIITNVAYPDWVKVGMAFDYEKRLNVYNQYDPETNFKIAGIRWTDDRRNLEKKILENTSQVASKQQGEWFKIKESLALDILYAE